MMSISRTIALTGLPALTVLALGLAGSLHAASQAEASQAAPVPLAMPSPVVPSSAVALSSPAAAPEPTPVPAALASTAPAAVQSPFGFTTEADRGAVWAQGDGLVRVQLVISSQHQRAASARVPTDLVVVLDTSGSMSGHKIDQARAAAAALVSQLGPEDRFSLVSFDSRATVDVPLAAATSGARARWTRALRGLDAGGSTDMEAGLRVGAGQHARGVGRARRTVLISDGMPDSQDSLLAQAGAAARAETPLTAVGIGDDYDEHLMSQLADVGTGNFYWVRGGDDLAQVFADELSTSRESVATGLAVRAHLGEGVQLVDAAGYPVSVEGGAPTFRVGSLYAGQERSFWVTLRLPTGAGLDTVDPGAFELVITEPLGTVVRLDSDLRPVRVEGQREAWVASLDQDLWGEAVVEEQYNRVRADVSRKVQSGDKVGALSLLSGYVDELSSLNPMVGSALVDNNIEEAQALQQEIEGSFEGGGQSQRQNDLAKGLNWSSYMGRRGGQSKSY